MLYCQAYPVRKMVPLDRLASASPCVGGEFDECPLFRELSCQPDVRPQRAPDELPTGQGDPRPPRPDRS